MENKEFSAQFFLSNLSHEIRTPLNGIVGYTQLLSQTKVDNTQQMYLQSMNRCCIQLVELVNDILDFSKLTTGKGQVNNECFSFKEIVDEVNSAIGYRVKEKRQKLRYVFDENLPEYIISDKHKIIQILINLVSNANKFTPQEGRIIVSVNALENNCIQCSVEDNGIGISRENQHRLFNPFFQVQETLTKNGTGLGLAICKKLVELLGGTISVESEKNHGSVFTFTIKYEPYEQFHSYVEKNGEIVKDKYILIIDSDIDNRLTLGEVLFEYGMRPIICSSSKEALRMITAKRYPFSLVLLDVTMPDITGTDLAKQIKQINPELFLVAMSSLDEEIARTNFEYILKKPINKVKLLDTIANTILKNSVEKFQLNTTEEKILNNKKDIRFLIAEDVPYNSDILIKMLNSMGYNNIDLACDGVEAVEKIEQQNKLKNPYDILLLDLKMPRMDGFGVAEWVKKQNYTYPKIAVITASVLENDKEKCRDYGIKYFLLKPFNMNHLKNIIKNILTGSGDFKK
jgi:CheY-like chemotaxis protein